MNVYSTVISLALFAPLTAQDATATASSTNHFLASFEFGAGGRASSSNHVLHASFGDGAVAARASTANHELTGGFNAALDAATTGRPWLSTVSPRYTAMRSGASVTIFGTELNLGSTVTIGGQAATVQTKAKDRITIALPNQPVPGWQPVTVNSTSGNHTLGQGIGILPMLETGPAAASDVPFSIVFRGSPGDTIVWALGVAPITPIPLGGFGYGFGLNPGLMMMLPGFGMPSADGVFKMSFPATTYPTGLIYVQAVFASSNPGYAPGAFTNILRL
jgi:hypothetical protein